MLDKFWGSVGGKLAERWLSLSLPALVFWFGGLIAYLVGHGGPAALSASLANISRQSVVIQGLLLLSALILISGSALLVTRLTDPALHVIEGYWPLWALHLWLRLRTRFGSDNTRRHQQWQDLAHRIQSRDSSLTLEDHALFLRLDRWQHRQPAQEHRLMPTRVGNILRTAESLSYDKYGLETIAVWPRLWLVLPEQARTELLMARQSMTSAVGAMLWGLLFVFFFPLTIWAVPVGIAIAVLAVVGWLPALAQTYGDLLEATFDMHRTLLYQQLRWPLPTNPAQEPAGGAALTAYLWRGSDADQPAFLDPL